MIRKVCKVNQQDNVPKEIEQDKPIEIPVDTLVQVYDEFTHEPSLVDTPVQAYDEFTHEPNLVDTPVQVYDEFTHESSSVDTPVQRMDEFTHASSPQTQQGREISSNRSL